MQKLIIIIISLFCFFLSCSAGLKNERVVQYGDIIYTHFTLNLLDGTRIDESLHKHSKQIEGQPIKFQVGESQVIKGWDDGVLGMKKGEIKTIEIPPELAYGKVGAYHNIKATDTLILKVKLIDWEN